jgi:hypothetical protein
VGIVVEVDAMREVQDKQEGKALFVTNLLIGFVPIQLRLSIHAWQGNGAEALGQLEPGMIVQFGQLFVQAQHREQNQQRGNFPYLLHYAEKRNSSFLILARKGGEEEGKRVISKKEV